MQEAPDVRRRPDLRGYSSNVLPRLRQVALVAHDLEKTAATLQDAFGWPEPFRDPGVGEFGLANAVFAAGDTFVEVVSPVEQDTTAGRYLERRGGDSGYMAIFQVADVHDARRRVAGEGIRVVWKVDFTDIAGTHLHPKDVPGAIVSIDWADPPGSWRWAGPDWTAGVPAHRSGGITGLTIEVEDPASAASRWASVLGLRESSEGGSGAALALPGAHQVLRFEPTNTAGEGITELAIAGEHDVSLEVAGVRIRQERQ